MAESGSNTDESLLSELVTPSECDQLLKALLDAVRDTVPEECLLSSPATSSMPSTDDYTGPHNFEVNVDSRSEGRNFLFSRSLNKLFIAVNTVMHMGFRCSSVSSDVYVRAVLIFTETQYFKEPVIRCVFHKHPQAEFNEGVDTSLYECVLRSDHVQAEYQKDPTSGRHSVRVALDALQAGAKWVTVPFKFVCKNSCHAGMNRRSTEVIFTLENKSGEVLGRRRMKVRICSCPKRDKDKEETDAATNQNQTVSRGKRKLAAHPEPQKEKVSKWKFEGSFEQTFSTREEFLDATVVAQARLKRRLCAEKRKPSEKEATLLQKYENDLNQWN